MLLQRPLLEKCSVLLVLFLFGCSVLNPCRFESGSKPCPSDWEAPLVGEDPVLSILLIKGFAVRTAAARAAAAAERAGQALVGAEAVGTQESLAFAANFMLAKGYAEGQLGGSMGLAVRVIEQGAEGWIKTLPPWAIEKITPQAAEWAALEVIALNAVRGAASMDTAFAVQLTRLLFRRAAPENLAGLKELYFTRVVHLEAFEKFLEGAARGLPTKREAIVGAEAAATELRAVLKAMLEEFQARGVYFM